jgi:hypothetical protein
MSARFPAGFGVPSKTYLPTIWTDRSGLGIERTETVSVVDGSRTTTWCIGPCVALGLGVLATYAIVKHPRAVGQCLRALAPPVPTALLGTAALVACIAPS